jgi:hypothetical protein
MITISQEMRRAAPTFIKGALAGMAALAIGAQFWPGYMLDSSAKASQQQAVEVANAASASVLCGEFYKAAPDSAARLTTLRSTTTYVGEDKDVSAAVGEALKAFKFADISPLPSEYSVKSDCVDVLRKKPQASAQLK